MKNKSFNNNLLVSMPHLNDTIFNKSVILICDHSLDGTMGLIINKPITSKINENIIFDDLLKKIDANIYFGGPVNLAACFILHDKSYCLDKSKIISNDLCLTSNKQIIKDIENGSGPNNFKLNLGYAGWDSGQLESEIKNGDWLMLPYPKNFIFEIPDEKKWSYTVNKLGLDPNENWASSGAQA